ncbi:MAG: outer membrane beta-barrel family protein [Wenyingzhuangia sp.]|uniref:outer membrane beta-barrel family protein n=1 Tax=Wenyingzhuangia sp. TaxID=1964193 RepID=UPI0032196217
MNKFLLLLGLFTQLVWSQANKNDITGVVINKTTREPIPFVSIYATNGDKTWSQIADENGGFRFSNLPRKKYILSIQSIGYKTYTQSIVFNNKDSILLKNISLEENVEALNTIVLRSETSTVTQKVDRIVINVGKDLTSIGAAAADVLDNIQSVAVDPQTGTLSLRGNTKVRVLIDGKPTNIPTEQLLQQIPSNAIKNIELITNPSAKYNPEGNSGMINIVLVKSTRLGFNGNITTTSQYGRKFRQTSGINLNQKTKNINFFGNYSNNYGKKNTMGNLVRNGPSQSVQEIDGNDDFDNHLLKFGVDIDLTSSTALELFSTQTFNTLKYQNRTKISETKATSVLSDNLFSFTRKPENKSYHAGIYQQFGDDKNHFLSLEGQHSIRTQPEDSDWEDTLNPFDNFSSNYTEKISNQNDLTLVNLDYTLPFGIESYIESGLSFREENTSNANDSTQEVITENGGSISRGRSTFNYQRKIYSAYLNYKQQFNKLDIQAGLRAESYQTLGDFYTALDQQDREIKQKVNSIYPSFFATYKLNEDRQLQFSYSRRVDRPTIKQITPIRTWGTPLVTAQGNQDLEQEFTNSLETRYLRKLKTGNVSTTLFYRHTKDPINRTISVDPINNERAILSYSNFNSTNSYGIEISTNLRVKKWWRLNASSDFYSRKIEGIVANKYRMVTNQLFNCRASNSFTVSNKLSLQLSAMYRGTSESLQRTRKPMYQINTGASYKIFNEKGTLSLALSDIFNTYGYRFYSDAPFLQEGQFKWETRKITLGFVYHFGIKSKKNNTRRRKQDIPTQSSGGMF